MAVDPPRSQGGSFRFQPSTSAVASTSAAPASTSNEKPADADRKPSFSLPSLIVRKVHGKNIAVSKADYEIANAYGFNPFCVVALETPDLSALFPKHKRKEKKPDGEEPRSEEAEAERADRKAAPAGERKAATRPGELIALGRPPIEKPKKTAKAEPAVAQPPPADKPTSSRAAAAPFQAEAHQMHHGKSCRTCTWNPRDQLFLTDRKGRLHANLAHINNLETFLLQKPYFEPPTRPKKARPDTKEREVRALVRERITKVLRTRCQFHDVEIAEKPLKELSFQIEMDLHRLIADVKDVRYRKWCQIFTTLLWPSFIDKLIGRVVTSAHLTSIPYAQLDAELHRLDEIEAAADANGAENSDVENGREAGGQTEARAAPVPPSRSPSKGAPTAATPSKPRAEVGRSAIDDILGSGENTTSKHSSHLYDANCDICKQKDQREAMMLEKMQKTEEKNRMERIPRKRDRQAMSNGAGYAESPPQQGGSSAGDPWGGGGDDGEPSGSSPMGRPAFSAYDRPSFFPRGPPTKTPAPNFHSPEGAAPAYPARREAAAASTTSGAEASSSIRSSAFRCNLGLLHNRAAALELRNELPDHLDMCGTVDCASVWREFEMASTQWNKQIIALVMRPALRRPRLSAVHRFLQ
ncbi:hypothetical protein M3Y99_00090900 [Aphelenchoides fujianensis]|nr:hypothetical protein M3Y99_00090900 [Aphelenchoides fujianensis]